MSRTQHILALNANAGTRQLALDRAAALSAMLQRPVSAGEVVHLALSAASDEQLLHAAREGKIAFSRRGRPKKVDSTTTAG